MISLTFFLVAHLFYYSLDAATTMHPPSKPIPISSPITYFDDETDEHSISPESQALFLSTALENSNEYKALKYLNKYPNVTGYPNPRTGTHLLFDALMNNIDSFYALRRILADPHTPIDARNQNGETALIWAVKNGESIYIRLLLNHDADVTLADCTGQTALHYAAAQGENIQILETLMVRGADPNVQDSNGDTPLHAAAGAGRPDSIQTLLESQADPSILNKAGKTAFEVAKNYNAAIILSHALKKPIPSLSNIQ
jgi:ankyrin repeat protein